MHGKPGLIHGAPSDSKTKPWLSHMPILQVSCCRTLGPLLPVASHSSAIACCVALEQRLGRAKFFAACMVGQIRCFGVNATSPRARESGSSCGHLIQAYLLVSSMAQAATLSMYPSSWISKIGMHANTSRSESFEFSQLPALRCVASPERLYCVAQLNRPLQPIDFQRIDLRAIC